MFMYKWLTDDFSVPTATVSYKRKLFLLFFFPLKGDREIRKKNWRKGINC